MHIVHLGLLYVCNGSGLMLGKDLSLSWSDSFFFNHFESCLTDCPAQLAEEFATSMWLFWKWSRNSSFDQAGQGIPTVQTVDFCKQNWLFAATFYRENGRLDSGLGANIFSRAFGMSSNVLSFCAMLQFLPFSEHKHLLGPDFFKTLCQLNSHPVFWQCGSIPVPTKLFKKNADILFTAKAYNSRVILEWLSREVYTASTADGASSLDPRFPLIAAALCFVAIYCKHVLFPLFLNYVICWTSPGTNSGHIIMLLICSIPILFIFWMPSDCLYLQIYVHTSAPHRSHWNHRNWIPYRPIAHVPTTVFTPLTAVDPLLPRMRMSRFLGQCEQAGRYLRLGVGKGWISGIAQKGIHFICCIYIIQLTTSLYILRSNGSMDYV